MTSFKHLISVMSFVALCLGVSTPATATTFLNGNFSTPNLNDYDVRRCTFLCGADGTNSAGVEANGFDNYLRLSAPSYVFGAGQIEVSQTVSLMSSATILSFDAGIISDVSDPFNQTLDGFVDGFGLQMRDGFGTLYSLFRLTAQGGATISTFAPDPNDLTITALTGSVFGYNFKADLSDFAGQDITLIFLASSRADKRVTDFGVDNIGFSATNPVSTVPLPAGVILMLTCLGALAGLGRARRRTA